MRNRFPQMIWLLVVLLVAPTMAFGQEKPSFDLDWYGYFKLDGSYDQNLTSHGNFVLWVTPQSYEEDDTQFNMTANQTRFGVNLTGNQYRDVEVKGKLEFDLYAAVTGATVAENKAMLQLRHAYFSVQRKGTKLVAGQTSDLISPLNPSTLNYPVLWGCGNIGYRRPQVSLFQSANMGMSSQLTMAAGFFRTIGSDLTPTFSLAAGETTDGSDDGTDAAIPTVQGQLDFQHKLDNGGLIRLGGSALWGRLRAETTQGNFEEYETWAGAGHLQVSLSQSFGVMGEYYQGANLGSYLGGILNSSTIDGVNSMGGWGSMWVKPTSGLKLTLGYGFDDPDDEDLGGVQRSKNESMFGNIQYTFVPQVTVGLEVSRWETTYTDDVSIDNLRVQTSFILNF